MLRLERYTRKQNIIVCLVILAVILLTSLSYLWGYLASFNSGDLFLASNYSNYSDYNVYLSYMEQAKEGDWLFSNLYTSELQKPVFFSPLWLVLGKLAAMFNLNSQLVYHLARIISIIIFLYFIFYYFLDIFCKKFDQKMTAFVLIAFSAGMDVFFPQKYTYIGQKVPEAVSFFTMSHSALFVLSHLLIILAFYFFLKPVKRKIDYLYLFLISLILGFIHTYDLMIILAVLGIYFIIALILKKQSIVVDFGSYIMKVVLLLLGFIPALIYFCLVVFKEPALANWLAQNFCLSPGFGSYLINYGVLLCFACLSLYLFNKKNQNLFIFLLVWIITIFVLLYFPVPFQRRLINTLHIALSILASYSLYYIIIDFWQKLNLKNIFYIISLALIVFLLFFSGTIYFVGKSIYNYKYGIFEYYFLESKTKAVWWLKDNSFKGEVILSTGSNGVILPALTGLKVFIGHAHQTNDYWAKKSFVNNWFFVDNQQDELKKKILEDYNVDYVFYADYEKLLGDWNLDQVDFLEKIYDNDGVSIYKVK